LRHPAVLRVEIRQGGVEPGQPLPEAAPRLPQRLQRGRERQRQVDLGVFTAPPERRAQVVDLDLGLLDKLLSAGASQGRERRVVITVTRPDGIGIAGLAELSSAYWRTVSSNR
jgi:hypothetical protein